jgi:hypothetical protein
VWGGEFKSEPGAIHTSLMPTGLRTGRLCVLSCCAGWVIRAEAAREERVAEPLHRIPLGTLRRIRVMGSSAHSNAVKSAGESSTSCRTMRNCHTALVICGQDGIRFPLEALSSELRSITGSSSYWRRRLFSKADSITPAVTTSNGSMKDRRTRYISESPRN